MKRKNKHTKTEQGKPVGRSKYALKRPRMYGPGCCGHGLSAQQMKEIRMENGTLGAGLRTMGYVKEEVYHSAGARGIYA